jgi:hypothetical protein
MNEERKMTTYIEVAQALVTAGYLSDADVDAAAEVLADALVVTDAEEAEAEARDDLAYQEQVITSAEANAYGSQDKGVQEDVIEGAIERGDEDEATIEEAEDTIAAAYNDAAAALLAAELIDGANLDDVVGVITEVWVEDGD